MKATPDTSDEDVIAIGLSLSGKKCLYSDKCTMQQFVPHHIHIRQPLGKHFDRKYVIATMKHSQSQIIQGSLGQ